MGLSPGDVEEGVLACLEGEGVAGPWGEVTHECGDRRYGASDRLRTRGGAEQLDSNLCYFLRIADREDLNIGNLHINAHIPDPTASVVHPQR